MTIDKKQIELALLFRKRNDLEKEIREVREAHKRNEYAKTNTYQLKWVNESIARRLGNGSRYK